MHPPTGALRAMCMCMCMCMYPQVRFEPIEGRRYAVVSPTPLHPRRWPADDAHPSATIASLPQGCEVRPCAAAIDADGCLEWLAVPIGEGHRWLADATTACGATGEPDDTSPERVPTSTLRAHLELLRDPPGQLAWLPVYDADDTPLLERLPDVVTSEADADVSGDTGAYERTSGSAPSALRKKGAGERPTKLKSPRSARKRRSKAKGPARRR